MQTWIAILRGINVSGQKKIKMADLRKHLEGLAMEDIQTYIQSGNIAFRSPEKDERKVAGLISERIREKYGFEVDVQVRRPEELDQVLSNNPFLSGPHKSTDRMYVTFLAEEPAADRIALLDEVDYSPEEYALDGRTVYFYSPNGYGRAKMNNNFFEAKLKVSATTRNWKTVNKLREMGDI